jgi:hypothetical protein
VEELYSERSGLCRELFTRGCLSQELPRAAASGRDLVLIIMGREDRSDPGGALYRRFADEAIQFFGNRDFLFERGKGDILAVIPGIDLDQGLARVEEFRLQVLEDLEDFFSGPASFRAGLSSRSNRPVDPDRLLFEAGAAQEKALGESSSPVVAFRSDPEKYRAFMAAQREEVVKAVQNTQRP